VKVSLVATVKNAASHVGPFLESIAAQSRAPDEVVVVDGGSGDGTAEILRRAAGITLIEEPGANIARGRNLAIRAAAHDAIAVSDADCVLEPEWLERLVEALERGADVSMGFYRPIADGFLQECMAAVNLPSAGEIREDRFMPSGRSVAFTREAFEAAGGYPEWLDIGEDMYVNHRWRELRLDMRLASGAVANWRLRPTLSQTWGQYFGYARGDAIARMHPERNSARLAAYSIALFAWSSPRGWPRAVVLAAAAVRAARPVRRALTRLEDPAERVAAVVAVPSLMAFTDVAKMAGYLAGMRRTRPARQS
jgi:glycosyltransferase involved in cell wall biosynthesis